LIDLLGAHYDINILNKFKGRTVMAGFVNKAFLIGNLGKDPELRYTSDSKKTVLFLLATSEAWKDKTTGEPKEKTEWHRIVILDDNLCDIAHKYLKKGSKVYIEGQVQTRKWTDKEKNERYTTEIVLQQYRSELTILNDRINADENPDNAYANPPSSSNKEGYKSFEELPGLNDEVSF
jgi:single-strand DNA-binding protein